LGGSAPVVEKSQFRSFRQSVLGILSKNRDCRDIRHPIGIFWGRQIMRKLFLGSVALITLVGIANAADMPVKALKAAPPIDYLWDGFYVGGYYGDAISQSSVRTPIPTDPIFHRGEINVNDHQFTAGVTAGYNRRIGSNFLVGVEGDVGYLGFNRTFKEYNDVLLAGEKADWYSTLRARAGYLTGPSLLYVTGGAAFVHTTDTFGGLLNFATDAITVPAAASTTTRTGWTAGGGIETKLSRNWSAKTEYLYIDTGTNTFVANPFGANSTTTFSHNIHVFKSGLNYNFGGGPGDGISSLFNTAMLPSNHSWSGFYAGLNAGGGMSNVGASGAVNPVFLFQVRGLNDINGSGFAGGVQAGYNYMITPRYFVGVEGDFGYLGMRQNLYDWFDEQDNFTLKTSWYGTARVRAGVSTGPALLYVTGGAAWVRLADGFGPTAPPNAPFPGDVSWTTRSGWTVGGGTEVALDAHWSAKIETLYIDTGIRKHNDTEFFAFYADFRERFAIARVGLNYKFGNDVVTARY
jgi:outer membrane immunogenic protein